MKKLVKLNESQLKSIVTESVKRLLREFDSDEFFGDLNNKTDNLFNYQKNEDDEKEVEMCCEDLAVYLQKIKDSYDPVTIRKALELELEKYNEY